MYFLIENFVFNKFRQEYKRNVHYLYLLYCALFSTFIIIVFRKNFTKSCNAKPVCVPLQRRGNQAGQRENPESLVDDRTLRPWPVDSPTEGAQQEESPKVTQVSVCMFAWKLSSYVYMYANRQLVYLLIFEGNMFIFIIWKVKKPKWNQKTLWLQTSYTCAGAACMN